MVRARLAQTVPRLASLIEQIGIPLTLLLVVAAPAVVLLLLRGMSGSASAPHFQALAQALLHGHLYLSQSIYDGSPYRGHVYLPFGPLPGLLMIPMVILFGPAAPVQWVGLLAAGTLVTGLNEMWTALRIPDTRQRAWLTVATLIGTCLLGVAVINSSYFVTHVVVVSLLTWALALALRGEHPLIAGLLIGLAAMTRLPAVLAAPAILMLYAERHPTQRLASLARVAAGIAPAFLLLGLYNLARFGSPLETGYRYQSQSAAVLAHAFKLGSTSLVHLPKNLYFLLIAPPLPIGGQDTAVLHYPWLVPSDWGMGVIFVSPWLLAAFLARGRLALILALGAIPVLIPGVLQFGGGWVQFGYRYSLDALPFTAALAALAIHQRDWWRGFRGLATASVAVNVWGADWLLHRLAGT